MTRPRRVGLKGLVHIVEVVVPTARLRRHIAGAGTEKHIPVQVEPQAGIGGRLAVERGQTGQVLAHQPFKGFFTPGNHEGKIAFVAIGPGQEGHFVLFALGEEGANVIG